MDAGYEALDASQKLDKLWKGIQGSIYPAGTALPTQEPGAAEQLGLVWPPHLKPSFLHCSDILPAGRSKLIHTFGSVAKVTLQIDSASRQATLHPPAKHTDILQIAFVHLFNCLQAAAGNDSHSDR